MRQKLVPFLKGTRFCLVRPSRRSAPLPPAAGGVREDDDEDRNDVGAHGTGYAKTTDQDVVITRGTIGYAVTRGQEHCRLTQQSKS